MYTKLQSGQKRQKYKWPKGNKREIYSEDNLEYHYTNSRRCTFSEEYSLPDLERLSKWLKQDGSSNAEISFNTSQHMTIYLQNI